jgi:magnesium transporter
VSRDDATWRRAARLARGALPLRTGPWAAAGPHGAGPDEDADATSDRPARAGRGIDEVIGDCALYEDGRRRPGRIDLQDAGRTARSVQGGKGFVWIGLQQPTAEEIAVVADAFGLPALAVEDAVKAHQRPKLEVYGDVVFVVIKPVRYVDHEEVVDVTEIAVFLGRNFVVTVRHGNSDVLRTVRAEIDDEGSRLAAHGPTGVLYRTADLVVDGYEEAISSIDVDVDEIELQVFGAEQHDVDDDENSERIYKLKREIAEFRRAVGPLALPVQRLADGAVAGVDAELLQYFRDVHDHVLRAADAIEVHDRLLSDVLQAELARVAARQSRIAVRQNEIAVRQNEDMRKISAWAAIALVPTAIAGIYGMNFENMPELETQYGYFVVLGVITSACATLYLLFRRNGWL